MSRQDFERFEGPSDPKEVARDWQGEPIYEGDQYVQVDRGLVLIDDVGYYLLKNGLIEVVGDE